VVAGGHGAKLRGRGERSCRLGEHGIWHTGNVGGNSTGRQQRADCALSDFDHDSRSERRIGRGEFDRVSLWQRLQPGHGFDDVTTAHTYGSPGRRRLGLRSGGRPDDWSANGYSREQHLQQHDLHDGREAVLHLCGVSGAGQWKHAFRLQRRAFHGNKRERYDGHCEQH
jgi:hypothetical protein